jgi:hypothetical protein
VTWEVTDGIGGPVLASGRRLTRRGAEKAAAHAAALCGPWEPDPDPEPALNPEPLEGVCRCDRPVLHPLKPMDAYALTRTLELADIPVTVKLPTDNLVELWPALALTTRQVVRAQRLVQRATDAPVRWAGVA